MQKLLKYLAEHTLQIFIAYVLIQLILVIFWSLPYSSDSLYYYGLAQTCITHHSFYPARIQLYEDYISAPLYINLLIIILSVYNSPVAIGILNIILNTLQLFLLYKITCKLFGRDKAATTVLLYIFYLNTLGMVLMNFTEFFFGTLILSSIYFYLKGEIKSYFFSGIFAAASIAVRPLGWALLAAYLIMFVYRLSKKAEHHYRIVFLIGGFLIFLISYGLFTYSYFGRFVFTSTNGPVNLLIGANDGATGAFNSKVFENGNAGYIPENPKLTYVEKDNFWMHQAVKWIKEHPVKWVALLPAKFVYMFAWDDVAIAQLLHLPGWNIYLAVKKILTGKKLSEILAGNPWYIKAVYFTVQIFNQIFYLFVLYLIITGILLAAKEHVMNLNLFTIIIFITIGIAMTLMIFGMPRFKYTYLIACLPFAALKAHDYIIKRGEIV